MKCKSTGRDCIFGDACELRDHCIGVSQAQLGKIQEVSQQQYQHMLKQATTQPPQQPDRLKEGANAIRARIKEERALYKHYLGHAKIMNDIEDLHGAWDANCNASEVSCRIDGLLYALEALGELP